MELVRINGNVRIAYDEINPAARQTVLFVHGWPLGRRMWEYQLNFFAGRGYRCIAPDLPGFGGSSTVGPSGYTYDRQAEHLLGFIRALGLGSVTLAGFSMGGAVALRYAARYSCCRIKKLALIGAAAPSFVRREGYPLGMTAEEADELILRAEADRPKAADDFLRRMFYTDASDAFMSWLRQISFDASGIGTVQSAVSLKNEDLRGDLNKIKAPVGIFHGRQDTVCPFDFALEMYKNIRGAELYPFEDAGHGVFYDAAGEFNSALYTFIEKQ